MTERNNIVTIMGNPVTLLGDEIKPGMDAPDVELMDNDLKPFKLSNYKGKVTIVSAVTSLDTGTCDTETRRFNQEAAALGDDVAIVTVSMDLPFAQKRWCGAAGIDKVKTLSDYRSAEFGKKYGILIKDLNLLARTVFVVDKDGDVQYVQHVKENSKEPDYDDVLKAVKKLKA